MAPRINVKEESRKMRHVRSIHGSLMQDVATMRRQLEKLRRKADFLLGETHRHQAQILAQDQGARVFRSKEAKFNLQEEDVEMMVKRKETQELVSVSGVSLLEACVERVEGLDEDLAPQQEEEEEEFPREKGVVKVYSVEGRAGDIAYATKFSTVYNLELCEGKVVSVEDLRLVSGNRTLKQLLSSTAAALPSIVHRFTNDIYYFQMLYEEREESLQQLESDVPSLEVVWQEEPLVVRFLPSSQLQVHVLWALLWDHSNRRFKYEISVECEDDVVARYSSSSEVFPFLSGEQILETRQQVVDFIEAFLEL